MRLPQNSIVFFLFIALIILGCAKEYSYEGGINPGTGATVKSEWEFSITPVNYSGPVDTAYLTMQGSQQVLTLTGKSGAGVEKLFLSIKSFNGSIQTGKTYKTINQEVNFLYTGLRDTLYSAIPYNGGEISVTIISIDSSLVAGTFKGTATDKNGKSHFITGGRFSSPLKSVVNSDSKGTVMLWAKEGCNGPVKVKVNNADGEISVFSLVIPDCGDAGRATYNLLPGIYNWAAYCGKDSVSGKVEIKTNNCSKILVVFPFKPSPVTETVREEVCKVSNISFSGCLLTQCPGSAGYKPYSNAVNSYYAGNTLNSLTYTTTAAGFPFKISHPLQYEANKMTIDAGTKNEIRFTKDVQGRVIEYHGLKDPAIVYPLDSALVKYEYDNSGNLIKRTVIDARYLAAKKEMNFTWQNGNVIKIIEKNLASGETNETDFEYYTEKEVRSLPFAYTGAIELLMFQPGLNLGNYMKNPVKRQITHAFDINRNPVLLGLDFINYILDDNNYVLRFTVANQYGTTSSFSFKYRCF